MRKFVASFVLGMAVVCFSGTASVAKADVVNYSAMHELSVSASSNNFDAGTNTFWITPDDRSFSFTLGYDFAVLDSEEWLSTDRTSFPLLTLFDRDLFTDVTVVGNGANDPNTYGSHYLGYGTTWRSGTLHDVTIDNLLTFTFTLSDSVSLDDFVSQSIAFALNSNYADARWVGLDAPVFMVAYDAPNAGTPEPGTLAVLGLGLAGLAVARRRRK